MQLVKILLSTLAYFVSSFLIQGVLAAIIASDYFSNIPVFRIEPIFLFEYGLYFSKRNWFHCSFPNHPFYRFMGD